MTEHAATGLTTDDPSQVEQVGTALVRVRQPIVNLYFYGHPHGGDRSWVLIDAGLPYTGSSVRAAAERRFGPGSRPSAIVLTHGHFDHVGDLPALAEAWDVPIYAHELELPYLNGQSPYPPSDPTVGGGAMSWFSKLYPNGPFHLGRRLRALPADGTVPGMRDWRWIHTPGHSPGHVSLFREFDRLLIAGDAFVTTHQESMTGALLQQPPHAHRPPAYYTCDWDAARASVAKLAELKPELAVTGHGAPLQGKALRRELVNLVLYWDQESRPSWGRYIHQPALTDARGVVSLPPPVLNRQLLALAAVGGLAVGLGLFWASRDRSA